MPARPGADLERRPNRLSCVLDDRVDELRGVGRSELFVGCRYRAEAQGTNRHAPILSVRPSTTRAFHATKRRNMAAAVSQVGNRSSA